MIEVSTTCPECSHYLRVERCEYRPGWMALCPNCYGPVEDSGFLERLQGYGPTAEEALWDWTDQYEEEREMTIVIGNSLLTALQRQVEEETKLQRGCTFHRSGLFFLPGTTVHELEQGLVEAGGKATDSPVVYGLKSEAVEAA